ncbi:putative GPI-anchored protein 58 [Iris pallida]|uniref:GPI-anchored protein 58 n=1 Tax=Iris pallida TaxID=29817 RepID=A0AAX6ICU7_IRIPA|nr:putative GPI-anchored protein 58 [Iris pallida]
MAAHSRTSPAWPGRVAAQQQHAPGAQQLRSQQSRAHAVERRRRRRASPLSRKAFDDPPPAARASGDPPRTRTLFPDAPNSLFVRFERRSVVTHAKSRSFWRSVAATSRTFFRRFDRWIGDFFALSQSRFAGPTSSACISSTAAPFGVLPVPVRSWTLWLQWDLLYLSAVQVIEANSLEVPASLEETH